jgi:hypothetical protein
MAKKMYHGGKVDPFKNGMKATRPGYGVPYSEPFPKNGFIDHVIMKNYEDEEAGELNMNNPYHTLEDIDKLNRRSRGELVRSAKGKKGPF